MTTTRKEDIEIKRTFSETLPCPLTEAELANIARKIGAKRREIQDYEAKKRQSTDQFKALIDGAQATADQLAEAADKGVEQREIVCVEAFVWSTGRVEVRRSDSKEVVRERAMTVEERQAGMPWAPPGEQPKEPKGKRSKTKGIPLLAPAEHDREEGNDNDSTDITNPGGIIDGMPPEEPKPKWKRGKKGSRR